MYQKFYSHRLPRKGRHVYLLVDPSLPIFTLMEDGLQNGAVAIGDMGILPVELNGVSGVIPVVKT